MENCNPASKPNFRASIYRELKASAYGKYHPGIYINCVIITFCDHKLKILISKSVAIEKWKLPGGFPFADEDMDTAAHRILRKKTGLRKIIPRQLHLFGKADRNIAQDDANALQNLGLTSESDDQHWFLKRRLSMVYFSFVRYDRMKEENLFLNEEYSWVGVDELPVMYGDHNLMVAHAIDYLGRINDFAAVALELLPPKFTMPELHSLYENIFGCTTDRRNFQTKMMASGKLRKLNETRKGLHKDPFLYSWKKVGGKLPRPAPFF